MSATCPACSQVIPLEQLCRHDDPVCAACCEHDHEWEDAA